MAYFSNGSEGSVFDYQCSICKYGNKQCPIAAIQMEYNYDQIGNKLVSKILNDLVKDDGSCSMWNTFRDDLDNTSDIEIKKAKTLDDVQKIELFNEIMDKYSVEELEQKLK